ncbi:MAG TPA: hypothetical protein VNM37_14805 [Candidatus Dormibacteraeota bacterium]|jgi:hypothetical protein|nr:hypothetical protein [Candidatus Dormibacteraeota bacterium]
MRRISCCFVAVAGLLLGGLGCSKKEEPPKAAGGGGNPLTAPVDYISSAAKAQQSAAKTVTGVGLDKTIQLFYGQEGRFPKDLNELVPGYINAVPPPPRNMKYDYDPKTGVLKIVPQ